MEPSLYETMTDSHLRMARTLAQQQAAEFGRVMKDAQKARRRARRAAEAIEAELRSRGLLPRPVPRHGPSCECAQCWQEMEAGGRRA